MFKRKKKNKPEPLYVGVGPRKIEDAAQIQTWMRSLLEEREAKIEQEKNRRAQYDARVWHAIAGFAISEANTRGYFGTTIALDACKCPSSLLDELYQKGFAYNHDAQSSSHPERLDVYWTISGNKPYPHEMYYVHSIGYYERQEGVHIDEFGHVLKQIN